MTVEADDSVELDEGIKNLAKIEGFQDKTIQVETNIPTEQAQPLVDEVPKLGGNLQCSDAIVEALGTGWGRRPRAMPEFRDVFEANALYFSKGTLSGALNYQTKKGVLRRIDVNGSWGYVLNNRE